MFLRFIFPAANDFLLLKEIIQKEKFGIQALGWEQPFISVRMNWHITGLHSLLVSDVGFGVFIASMKANVSAILISNEAQEVLTKFLESMSYSS